MKYGSLTVLKRAGSNKWGQTLVKCLCDCGETTVKLLKSVKNGDTRSCGCLRREYAKAKQTKHGKHGSKTYFAWRNMINRCHNPKVKSFSDYGAKGISVCVEWRVSFACFLQDMGDCPDGFSIERKDNTKGYAKGNCIWIPRFDQGKNRTNHHWITIGNETKYLSEWANLSGLNITTILARVKRGCPEESILCPV